MKQKLIDGYRLKYDEAVDFFKSTSNEEVYDLANGLREHFKQKRMSTCMIMNAKSGSCSEDCKWCAQSIHYNTSSPRYKLVSTDDARKDARVAKKGGVKMFSLVTSGRKLSPSDLDGVCSIFETLRDEIPELEYCASLGLLSYDDLKKLYKSGVRRYHCNLETAPSFFPKMCSSHTIENKIETIKSAKKAGMQICSGGIIGLGESPEQRIELAATLQELKVDSIPINILLPIKGTPLEGIQPLSDEEILISFAIFRIMNPEADIRFAAGRVRIKHICEKALKCGISASLVGDMLTTTGSGLKEDMSFFKTNGYDI